MKKIISFFRKFIPIKNDWRKLTTEEYLDELYRLRQDKCFWTGKSGKRYEFKKYKSRINKQGLSFPEDDYPYTLDYI